MLSNSTTLRNTTTTHPSVSYVKRLQNNQPLHPQRFQNKDLYGTVENPSTMNQGRKHHTDPYIILCDNDGNEVNQK